MPRKPLWFLVVLIIAAVACQQSAPAVIPTLQSSVFDTNQTAFGFFPTPAEVSLQAVFDIYKKIGQHGNVVLMQREVPWNEFVKSANGESKAIEDIHNQYILAHQNNLDVIFIVDPLNGLNRREFINLPFGWKSSFGNPDIRSAITNFTLRVVREYKPAYLGLGSEINTYADTSPDDFPNYISLYEEIYSLVKAETPDTKIFVTFQWEEMNNLIPGLNPDRKPYEVNWNQMEVFEPHLDVWAISSYPFIAFPTGADIPADYYAPLLDRTNKPLAVAEGGFPSIARGNFPGTQQDQVDYLKAIHDQIGSRLDFWIYLILNDFNMDAYEKEMRKSGHSNDAETLSWFSKVGLMEMDGTPKQGLAVWDDYREQ
jgi:hypothetical protein